MNNVVMQMINLITSGLLIFLISCHGNRMETDEKNLASEIILDEQAQQEADRLAREQRLTDTLNRLPSGFRFREDRSVDPAHPPVVIDIAGNLGNSKAFSLSDVASEISYVRLDPPPDSTFPRVMKFKYYLMNDHIVAVNPSGILLYSKEGRYLCTVVKNESTGIEVKEDRMIVRGDHTFVGGGTSIWAVGENLYYKYSNTLFAQDYIMEFDCSGLPVTGSMAFDPENPDKIRGLGLVVADLNLGRNRAPSQGPSNGMWMASPEYLYQRVGSFLLDHNSYARQVGTVNTINGQYMMAVFNTKGDTLSTFSQLERLDTFSKSVMRGTDRGDQYEKNGQLYYRNAFNDTLFRVEPPNRLIPCYVIQLGKYKLAKADGLNPGFDLEGKIIPETWAETKEYLFITFSKDSYDCPNTRKNKQLKLYYAIFTKSDRTLYIVSGDPKDYDAEVLVNDLDGGLPVWPLSYMIGNNGEMLVSLKGNELKERVRSALFISSTALPERKEKLKRLAESTSDSDDILMIVK